MFSINKHVLYNLNVLVDGDLNILTSCVGLRMIQSRFTRLVTSYSQIHVVLHESHAGITRPALLVVVADDVLVVRVRMLGQVALDQVTCFFGRKPYWTKNNTRSSRDKKQIQSDADEKVRFRT